MSVGFTPTEGKLMSVLWDGKPHPQQELARIICNGEYDKLGEATACKTLSVHLTHIRKKLRTCGQDVSTELVNRLTYFRLVRLIGSSYR